MSLPAVTTRSGQLLELSIKSDEIMKFAICSLSFPCRPFAVFQTPLYDFYYA